MSSLMKSTVMVMLPLALPRCLLQPRIGSSLLTTSEEQHDPDDRVLSSVTAMSVLHHCLFQKQMVLVQLVVAQGVLCMHRTEVTDAVPQIALPLQRQAWRWILDRLAIALVFSVVSLKII